MLDRFETHFRRDAALSHPKDRLRVVHQTDDPLLQDLLHRLGGDSFNGGLYRVMATSELQWAGEFVARAFPSFSRRVRSFGYDWLGRIFSLDSARKEDGLSAVVMLEPGTGEALEIPCNLLTFHDDELIHHAEEALAAGFYAQWLDEGGAMPRYDQCVGYKRPLYLGGNDGVENVELSDLDVHWSLSGQLIEKTLRMT